MAGAIRNPEAPATIPDAMQLLTSPDDLDAVLERPLAVVYKHSTRCPISVLAADEVARFEEEQPEVPVYVVDVIDQRMLSRQIAARLEVVHHSPQAIVLAHGRVAWHGSHFDVRREALAQRVAGLIAPVR
jgi:bacillithiol system protein YtxJ